jgi:hypothetical protein
MFFGNKERKVGCFNKSKSIKPKGTESEAEARVLSKPRIGIKD